jgi:hypothetical protein
MGEGSKRIAGRSGVRGKQLARLVPKRTMSAAARRRIAAAQWANFRAAKKKAT